VRPVDSSWTRSRWSFRFRISATVSGSTLSYDARTDEFSEIGKQYGTKPGFYLMAGPNWTGNPPAGVTAVVRSSTTGVLAAPRVFLRTLRRITRQSSHY
jgi:hypothetical protein